MAQLMAIPIRWDKGFLARKLLTIAGAVLFSLALHPRTTAPGGPSPTPSARTAVKTKPSLPLPERIKIRPAPKSPPVGHLYHIRWGDSLWSIARRFDTSVLALQEANQLTGDEIYAGHYLVLPYRYRVKAGDTLATIARRFAVPLLLLWHENRLNSDKVRPGQDLVIPYRGQIPPASYAGPAPPAAGNPLRLSDRGVNRPAASPEDLLLLARLVQAEAGNQPFIGQVAVAAVALNRLHTAGFPKTLDAVIAEPGQFETVADGRFWNAPGPLAFMAAKAAWQGWDPTGGALYFFNPALPHASWMNTLPVAAIIGSQVFCR